MESLTVLLGIVFGIAGLCLLVLGIKYIIFNTYNVLLLCGVLVVLLLVALVVVQTTKGLFKYLFWIEGKGLYLFSALSLSIKRSVIYNFIRRFFLSFLRLLFLFFKPFIQLMRFFFSLNKGVADFIVCGFVALLINLPFILIDSSIKNISITAFAKVWLMFTLIIYVPCELIDYFRNRRK